MIRRTRLTPLQQVALLAIWILLAWGVLNIPRVRNWVGADWPVALAEAGIWCLFALLAEAARPNKQRRLSEYFRDSNVGTLLYPPALIVALVYSERFRSWAADSPLLFKVIGGYLVLYGLIVGVVAFIHKYLAPSLTGGLAENEAQERLTRVTKGVITFAYGAGLYYGICTLASPAGRPTADFWRDHLFDGFTCAAIITVGFELARPGTIFSGTNTTGPRVFGLVDFPTLYLTGVSALIGLSAAFVRGLHDQVVLAQWSGLAALAGLITGLLVAGGVVERVAKGIAELLSKADGSATPDNVAPTTTPKQLPGDDHESVASQPPATS